MKTIWNILMLILGEVLIVGFCLFVIRLSGGGTNLFAIYYVQTIPVIGIVGGVCIILFAAGQLRDFGRAFVLAVREKNDAAAGRKSCNALLCAMVSSLIMSVFITMAGVIAAIDGYSWEPEQDKALIAMSQSLCVALPASGILLIFLLLPIYFRIRRKNVG